MNHNRYKVLTTLEEDFRAIGILPPQSLNELDDSSEPRDIPSPDPSTLAGNDDSEGAGASGARNKYAKQPRPKMTPKESDDHDDPLEAGATQGGKKGGSYKPVAHGKEASLGRNEDAEMSSSYKTLKQTIMDRAKDKGKAPAVAQGLPATKEIAGMKKESAHLSRAAELVGEVEALLAGSQMSEDFNNLVHGFDLISENCNLLAGRLNAIAVNYNVDQAIEAMEDLYNSSIEASEILEMKSKKKDDDDDSDDDEEDEEEAMESIKEAFRLMTLQLMDAVEMYDATISESDEDDDDSDDDDDDDSDDNDDGDDDDKKPAKGGMLQEWQR